MRWSARKFVLMGFVVGLAASGGVILWTDEQSHIVARPAPPAAAPATPETSQELTTIVADVARWQSEMKSELTTLRAQLASVDHDQSATDQQLDQIADKIRRVGLEKTASTVGEKDAEAAPLTPEQEQERAAARNQAELTLMEGTLRAETSDLAWANTAQLALQTTFQQEALPGVQIVNTECRKTLCRMEFSLDDSTMQESYSNLPDLIPWSAPGFLKIDTETGAAVMYLAREEHSLPQLQE